MDILEFGGYQANVICTMTRERKIKIKTLEVVHQLIKHHGMQLSNTPDNANEVIRRKRGNIASIIPHR